MIYKIALCVGVTALFYWTIFRPIRKHLFIRRVMYILLAFSNRTFFEKIFVTGNYSLKDFFEYKTEAGLKTKIGVLFDHHDDTCKLVKETIHLFAKEKKAMKKQNKAELIDIAHDISKNSAIIYQDLACPRL